MKTKLILGIALFFITITAVCQSNGKFIDTGSVKNQFDYLINKSNKYKDYKVVKINWLQQLSSNVADSLSASEKEILSNYSLINSQKNIIDSLNTSLNKSDSKITSLNKEIQSISLFGIQFKKPVFKTMMFLIIGILAVLLIFFITKFKRSNSITTQTKLTLKEVETEFEEHRKIALEREQKVRRQLQDELNKQKKE
jgi:hypothetical protein